MNELTNNSTVKEMAEWCRDKLPKSMVKLDAESLKTFNEATKALHELLGGEFTAVQFITTEDGDNLIFSNQTDGMIYGGRFTTDGTYTADGFRVFQPIRITPEVRDKLSPLKSNQ